MVVLEYYTGFESLLVLKESRNWVLKYIRRCGGNATKNKVVDFMSKSNEVPEEFKTSRMTTYDIIEEFETGGRIKVMKGKRPGQSHYLIINDESIFDQITQRLSKLENRIDRIIEDSNSDIRSGKVKGEQGISTPNKEQMYVIYDLAVSLAVTKQDIMSVDDKQSLTGKIADLIISTVLRNKCQTISD